MTTCKNCLHNFEGKFCNECGQSAQTSVLDFKYIWYEIQHNLIPFDRGVFFTLKELALRPGRTIHEFIDGKRVNHYKPMAFILLLGGILEFVLQKFNILDSAPSNFSTNPEFNKLYDTQFLMEWMKTHMGLGYFLMIPLYSLATYWAFKKMNYNFIQHIILNTYLSGFEIFLNLLCVPFVWLFPGNKFSAFYIPDSIIGILYTIWGFYQFFDTVPPKKRVWKIFLSYVYKGLIFLVFSILIGIYIGISYARSHHH